MSLTLPTRRLPDCENGVLDQLAMCVQRLEASTEAVFIRSPRRRCTIRSRHRIARRCEHFRRDAITECAASAGPNRKPQARLAADVAQARISNPGPDLECSVIQRAHGGTCHCHPVGDARVDPECFTASAVRRAATVEVFRRAPRRSADSGSRGCAPGLLRARADHGCAWSQAETSRTPSASPMPSRAWRASSASWRARAVEP